MNAGATTERVYGALKAHLLSGAIAPGEKLEPASFAERWSSSVTPVRDALHRLVGEQLVETRTSEGFHLPLVTEPILRDRYGWNAELMRLISRSWPSGSRPVRADGLAADIGRATAEFFALFAARSANHEHGRQVQMATDRLTAARVVEAQVLPGLEEELRSLTMAFDHADTTTLLKQVATYHRRRLQATPAIVRVLYDQPGRSPNNRDIFPL